MRLIALVLVALLVPAATAGAATCKSSDLRYPFQPGGPKTFGVFKLQVTNGTCRKAHKVARSWMAEFELELLLGRVKLPKKVAGFKFKSLPPDEAQTYRQRGRKGSTTLQFDYRVPNG
jgi:hypothetical protein